MTIPTANTLWTVGRPKYGDHFDLDVYRRLHRYQYRYSHPFSHQHAHSPKRIWASHEHRPPRYSTVCHTKGGFVDFRIDGAPTTLGTLFGSVHGRADNVNGVL